MATGPYPKLSAKAWRSLRARAATATSTKFTPEVVAAVLDMSSPKSAADNIVYPMRRLGLIDEEGSLTDRGHKWRIDPSYADACQEILDKVYPPDLASFVDGSGAPDLSQIGNWIQHQGYGGSNAKQMAATYVMIAEKKIPEASANGQPRRPPQSAGQTRTPRKAAGRKASQVAEQPKDSDRLPLVDKGSGSADPNVHLDIQIHIPADASADQIDRIFASMAKHLYQK